MWIPVLTAALSALLDTLPDSDRIRRALGLPGDAHRQLSFHSIPDVGAYFVPIRIWADGGGIWRAVSPEGEDFLSEFFKSPNYRAQENDFSFEWSEIPSGLSCFVYIDGQSKLPIAAWASGEHVDTFSTSWRKKGFAFWSGQKKRFELGVLRFRVFLMECFGQSDTFAPDSTSVPMPVPDFFPDLVNRLESSEDVEVPRGFKQWKDACLDGAADAQVLVLEQAELREVYKLWSDPLSRESLDYLREHFDLNDEDEGLSKKSANRLFELRIGVISESISNCLHDLESDRYSEANRLVGLLTTFPFSTDAFSHLEGMRFSLGPSDDPVDVLEVRGAGDRDDLETADVDIHFDSGHSFSSGVAKSLLDMGYLETESDLMKRIGTPVFSFPGELQGEWLLRCAIDDSIVIDGGEDHHLFLLIARDHGLLSEIISDLWSPTLDVFSRDHQDVISAFLARSGHRRVRR